LEEKTYASTVEGLKEAASEFAKNATSTESVPRGEDGERLLEVPGDNGDVGMPPEADDGLSLKDAAKRLSEHRQQKEVDREKLKAALHRATLHPEMQPQLAPMSHMSAFGIFQRRGDDDSNSLSS